VKCAQSVNRAVRIKRVENEFILNDGISSTYQAIIFLMAALPFLVLLLFIYINWIGVR
jgi:hypothetical protein